MGVFSILQAAEWLTALYKIDTYAGPSQVDSFYGGKGKVLYARISEQLIFVSFKPSYQALLPTVIINNIL